eukprot:13760-Heterococcus_DN1.PRE.2
MLLSTQAIQGVSKVSQRKIAIAYAYFYCFAPLLLFLLLLLLLPPTAIPINKAKQIMYELAAGRTIAHAYVGIQMTTITPDFARQNNIDPNAPNVIPEYYEVTSCGSEAVCNLPTERYLYRLVC